MKNVFIIGSKGIPAQYGGFETFVEELTKGKQSKDIQYFVSCMNAQEKVFTHNKAICFDVPVPLSGPAGRILHVHMALQEVEKYIQSGLEGDVIVYILGCRIGPLLALHTKKLHDLGVKILVNPDGLEWKRDKWNSLEKRFLKLCEASLVRGSDEVVCDSLAIEKYINNKYSAKDTCYIAYGAHLSPSKVSPEKYTQWLQKNGLNEKEYFLIVGRFVPENNYETIIKEFLKSKTDKKLAIVTNVEENTYFEQLKKSTNFVQDDRIVFTGTVYDQELLKKIREGAFAYFHGHEVGGTNPSLLEALSSTQLNLLLGVDFNKEVAKDAAIYWSKEESNLSNVINKVDNFSEEQLEEYNKLSSQRIAEMFTWPSIIDQYEKLFLQD